MIQTPAKFAVKMRRAGNALKTDQQGVVAAAALELKKAVTLRLAVAAPRGRLNVGKRGARIGVRYKLEATSATVFMFGPAQLIERDTRPHRIPRETIGRGRKKRANTKPISIPGVGVRQSAMHPGTKGKHPWERGVTAGLPRARAAANDFYAQALRKALR